MTENYNRGSEWRKWDLHVHTASSYDAYKGSDSDELLVKAWKKHGFAAVAITDHHVIDVDRINRLRELCPEITIFPGFEIRTDKGATNIHVISIFPEESDLKILVEDFNAILIRGHQKNGEDDHTLVRDLGDIVEFTHHHGGILTIHAGHKENGLENEISNALPVNMAIKSHIAHNIDIFEVGRVSDVAGYKNVVFKEIEEKPLILCSDNHNPKEYKVKEYLWIKADATFHGLIQTIMQPSERVFIGNLPEKLDKINKNKSAYIDKITIARIENPINSAETWFDAALDLNPALVAVIGNKGGGKSALSDVIGHLCKSTTMSYASFLNKDRFRKLPENKSNDYMASILWRDGKVISDFSLGESEKYPSIEESQYLPQKYIEIVCNDILNQFQKEIDKVIFSYVDVSEKGGTIDLHELIESRSKSIVARIDDIKSNLNICNKEIIKLENKMSNEYKLFIKASLAKCMDDLERHKTNKPNEVIKPDKEQDKAYIEALEKIKTNISQLESQEVTMRDRLTIINSRIEEIKLLIEEESTINERINQFNDHLINYQTKYAIPIDSLHCKFDSPRELLKKDLHQSISEKELLQFKLSKAEDASTEISIMKQIDNAKKELDALISQTDAAEKMYQKYLNDLSEWELAGNDIIGNITKDGSIKYYENELIYLENELQNVYSNKISIRKDFIRAIFLQKKEIANIYKELYSPVEKELIPLLENSDDKIEFNINIALNDKEIAQKLLSYVNQSMTGIFQGKTDAFAKMNRFIESTIFNDIESTVSFVESVMGCVYENHDTSNKKIKEKQEFYSLLTSLDYINAEYSLTLSGKSLQMLSPGERGIVLLVFYLALSKNNIPLIIDQPEDNLDNQSVFSRLVPCICEAKKKRQVIIVTHNPNIAIACDAEQIICSTIEKSTNRISYKSGSIENPEIRKKVVDILEGTMPAFELRKLKYTYWLYPDGNRPYLLSK